VLNLGQYNEADSRLTFDATYYNPARVRFFVQRLGRLFDAVSRNPDRTMKESLSMCGALRPSSLQRLTRGFVRALTGKRPAQRNSKRGTSLT
jgi:hypothetical protein